MFNRNKLNNNKMGIFKNKKTGKHNINFQYRWLDSNHLQISDQHWISAGSGC